MQNSRRLEVEKEKGLTFRFTIENFSLFFSLSLSLLFLPANIKMDAYEKGETLGQGTFGVVYKAVHKEVRRGASKGRRGKER